jgi:hypothetical protein
MLYILWKVKDMASTMKEKSTHKSTPERMREIVGILMESVFYFELTLKERRRLIQNILSS